MIPSSRCTSSILNLKKFNNNQLQDLWKFIAENAKWKEIIVKKWEDNSSFEVHSTASHHHFDPFEYNILNDKVLDQLEVYYSWPVYNCICKPKTLWISKNDEKEISWETIYKTLEISLLENAEQIIIWGNINTFECIDNLSKFKRQLPNVRIKFSLNWEDSSKRTFSNHCIRINSKMITWVTKGKEWNFEKEKDYHTWFFEDLTDLKLVKTEGILIIKCSIAYWPSIIQKPDCKSKSKWYFIIDDLKEKTKFNNDLFVIADANSWALNITPIQIHEYIEIANNFKHIEVEVDESDIEYKMRIKEINKLPTQWNIKIITYSMFDFVKSGALEMIKYDFESIVVTSFKYIIKLIKLNNKSKDRIFTVYDSLYFRTRIADINQLREMISKDY